jgi:hypothetical protein
MIDDGTTLSTLPFAMFEETFAAAIGRAANLGETDFRRFMTPEHFIAMRTCRRTGASPLAASFARYRSEIEERRKVIDAFGARRRDSQVLLAREVARRIAGP